MSAAGGAFGGSRSPPPKPPEKGVFPLDHFGECAKEAAAYKAGTPTLPRRPPPGRTRDAGVEPPPSPPSPPTQACLRQHDMQAEECRGISRAYLECRMDRGLMARQPLGELGLGDAVAGRGSPPGPGAGGTGAS